MTPKFQEADYVLSVIENGQPVPSPYLTNCPEVIPISLDTTESFELRRDPASQWLATERWAEILLKPGDYELIVDASRFGSSGSRPIFYSVAAVGGVGQLDLQNEIGFSDLDVSTRQSYTLTVDQSEDVYLRMTNDRLGADLSMEITLSDR